MRDVIIKKQISTTILLGTILLLSLATVALTPVAVSSIQFGKLQDKPSWAGNPEGPNGGDGDGDTTTYVLYIEIDYMEGHEPTQAVLDYIVIYYDARGITVTFDVDDPVPLDTSVTDEEFWAIEATHNDYIVYDDRAYGDYKKGVYTSKEKWVLFGTTVEGDPDVVGYAWVVSSRKDMLAGNYIFIADKAADDWTSTASGWDETLTDEQKKIGAEAAVLMHEMGHSIGIGKLHPLFGERYDPDPGSVMSYLSEANAGLNGAWYYSDEYWATRNMGYYEEIVA